ncbi:transcription factor AP-2-beta-like isoform X1, partial [Biomphalaria pfeifferi]
MSIAVAHVPIGATSASPPKYYALDSDHHHHLLKQDRTHSLYNSTPNSSCGDSSRDSTDIKSISSVSPDLPQDHQHYPQYPRHDLRGHRSSNLYGNPVAAPVLGGNIGSQNMPSAFGPLDGSE